MAVAARVKPKDFFTDREWAAVSARSSWRGVWLVVHCWGVIGLAAAAGVVWPILIPFAVMVIGARMLGLAILMHEAAHGGLHPNQKLNDALGHWLCAVPIGASLHAYRPYHLTHHKYAQQPEDPDLPLSAKFPVTGASLRRKMIRDLTGRTFFKQQIAPVLYRRPSDEPEGARVTARSALPYLTVHAVLLAGLTAAGVWWAWFALWLLPMATWFPLCTRLRNIAEHAVTPDPADPLRHARTTRANPLERLLIAPYWVNHHCEHHMFMHLPCYRLPAAHRLLTEKGVTARMEVQPGYVAVLKAAASAA